ncbi:MAG: hypothetical protein ACFB0C_19255 [Leptolyngbyaceae cyanobacterium]
MVRSLDQIHRDQDHLDKATDKIDAQLSETYQQYLSVLGDAVRQQLVLATYHLCTQSYPEAFLKLSLGQRETLQKRIRQLGKKGKRHIEALNRLDNVAATLNLLLQPQGQLGSLFVASKGQQPNDDAHDSEAPEAVEIKTDETVETQTDEPAKITSDAVHSITPPDNDNSDTTAPTNALLVPAQISQPFDSQALVPISTDLAIKNNAQDRANAADLTARDEADPDSLSTSQPEASQSSPSSSSDGPSPLNLAKRHVLLERQIRAVLHAISSMTNHTLQQAKILPDLPEAVLNAATEAGADEPSPKIPNLLNVIIEIGQEEDAKAAEETGDTDLGTDLEAERAMTHLVAVNLRLADIEFTDTRTALWRSKIQEILSRLKKLSRHYQKLQQERARAEAEAAWRATWFEEQPSESS